MRLEKLVYTKYVHGRQFSVDTIILRLENKTKIACSNFHFHNGKLIVYVYKPFGKWKQYTMRNKHTKEMYDYYCKGKHEATTVDYSKLMKHDRAHKKGSGGKLSPTQIVTDYECAKTPFHDFRRNMYVQYN